MDSTLNFEILQSVKGVNLLHFDGYLYQLNARHSTKTYWVCITSQKRKYNCHGRAIIVEDGGALCSAPHNHLPDPELVESLRRNNLSINNNQNSMPVPQTPPMPAQDFSDNKYAELHQNDKDFLQLRSRRALKRPFTINDAEKNDCSTSKKSYSDFGVKQMKKDLHNSATLEEQQPTPFQEDNSPMAVFLRDKMGQLKRATQSNQLEAKAEVVSEMDELVLELEEDPSEVADLVLELEEDPQPPSPIVKTTKTKTFSSAHRLNNPNFDSATNKKIYGQLNNPNGYGSNYTWTVVLKGPLDPSTGMINNLEFNNLEQKMAKVLELVDHKHLDKDVAYFRENSIVSTTENLAVFLYNELALRMDDPSFLKKVTVQEAFKDECSYSGEQN